MMTKNGLILLAAIVWFAVGLMLNWFAIRWFKELTNTQIFWAISIGLIIGILKMFLIFKKLIDTNVERIKKLDKKVPFWKFQRPGAYYFILGMMALGIFLRTSGVIAKKYLAPVYIGIGVALLIGSFYYFKKYNLIN